MIETIINLVKVIPFEDISYFGISYKDPEKTRMSYIELSFKSSKNKNVYGLCLSFQNNTITFHHEIIECNQDSIEKLKLNLIERYEKYLNEIKDDIKLIIENTSK